MPVACVVVLAKGEGVGAGVVGTAASEAGAAALVDLDSLEPGAEPSLLLVMMLGTL